MVLGLSTVAGCLQPPGYEVRQETNHPPELIYNQIQPPDGTIVSVVDTTSREFKLTGAAVDEAPGDTLYYYWWISTGVPEDRPRLVGVGDVLKFVPCDWVNTFPGATVLVLQTWVCDRELGGVGTEQPACRDNTTPQKVYWYLSIPDTLTALCPSGS